MAEIDIFLDSNPTVVAVGSAPISIAISAAQGPAGPAAEAGPNTVTDSTTSDGTADLSISNLTTATATVTGIMTAPTAVTLTSTTQVATTEFVQQELTAGTAVAKNLEFLARNQSGATIPKGSIVYISDATGNKPLITLAQANNDANSAQTIGFVKTDIAHNGTGYVIVRGEVEDLNTFALTEGDQLYLSPTVAGSWTTTKPVAPQHLVYVGICLRAHVNQGIILVAIQNGYELNELHDVLITTPAAKQVVKRNAGNTLWVNEAIVSADVSDATSAPTPSTLVLRNENGDSSFSAVETSGLTVTGGTTFGADSLVQFDALEYYFGTGAAEALIAALGAAEASHTHVVADITDIGSIGGGILVEVTADYTALYGNYLIVALNPARISLPPIEAGQISMTIANKSNGEVVIEGSPGDLVNDSAELILSRRNSAVQLKPSSTVGWVIT